MLSKATSRREFIKASVAAATAATVDLGGLGHVAGADPERGWRWDKGVCRFCGVGCGLQIATRDDRVVAVKGDPDSPVNRGLLCMKGYANAEIQYGADRLTRPLLRMKNGSFHKNGEFVPVSWKRALDEMEKQFKKAHGELGPTGVAIMGSGQYTIQEGYAAVKLAKAGWRSNNLDPNARHCMASAVAAFIQVFGIDEPAGNYDDIELTDTVVTWGANMAEMHPMLWARVTEKKMADPDYRIVNLTTYANRTSDIADAEIVFKPGTDLAIWNYIAREIVNGGKMDRRFVEKSCIFATGPYDIGYGMRATDRFAYAAEKDTQERQRQVVLTRDEAIAQRRDPDAANTVAQTNTGSAGKHWQISLADFKEALQPYTLDFVAGMSKGDAQESLASYKKKLQELAAYYGDKDRNIVSFWTMGFNQHARGT